MENYTFLSKDEILKEYAQGLLNPGYIIEKYLKTYDQTKQGYVPFILFPRQHEVIRSLENYRYNLVKKYRQAGISTLVSAYIAVKVGWADKDSPEEILILANKQDLAIKFLSKVKEFINQLPRWVWGTDYYGDYNKMKKDIFINNSKKQIKLPNKSEVTALATSEDAVRGYTPTILIMDEAAFIDNGADVYTTAQSSLSTGGKCILISTPNGYDELYFKTYDMALKKENDYNVIEMNWYEDPRYNTDLTWVKNDLVKPELHFTFESYEKSIKDGWKPTSTWYRAMCRSFNNNQRRIAQELDGSFLGSGGNVIDEEIIQKVESQCIDPQWYAGEKNEIWIWKKPENEHKYCLSADVARGDGEDFSAFVIIDFTTMEIVVDYKGKVPPDIFAQIIYDYALLYNAYTVIDITGGLGVTTVLKLLELNFPKKLLHYDEAKKNILNTSINSYEQNKKVPGFNAQTVRLPMISLLEESVRLETIKIYSRRIVSEMKTFVYINGRPDHMKGHHDDLIMSICMGLWVLEHSFKKLEKLQNQNKAILNGWLSSSSIKTTETTENKPNNCAYITNNYSDTNNSNFLWLFSKLK